MKGKNYLNLIKKSMNSHNDYLPYLADLGSVSEKVHPPPGVSDRVMVQSICPARVWAMLSPSTALPF